MNQEEILKKTPEKWPQITKTFTIDPNFTDTPRICPVCYKNCYNPKIRKLTGIRVQEGRKFQWWCSNHYQDLGASTEITYPIFLL